MRGRKRGVSINTSSVLSHIKKESPNEGTETPPTRRSLIGFVFGAIKKESPNEGTETSFLLPPFLFDY